MQSTEIKTLQYGQLIRLANWDGMTAAKFFTVEGYERANGASEEKVSEAVARTIRLSATDATHTLVGSIYAGSCLTDDKGYYERRRAEIATAITIEDGETISAEGRTYRVKVMKGCGQSPRFSDPIHFTPLPKGWDSVEGGTVTNYRIVQQGQPVGNTTDIIAFMEGRGHKVTGYNNSPIGRAELKGQPEFAAFAGPMWDGDAVRYEDWATYNLLSI